MTPTGQQMALWPRKQPGLKQGLLGRLSVPEVEKLRRQAQVQPPLAVRTAGLGGGGVELGGL